MPDNDPKWAAQKRCDNNRKDVKAERRKITNWVKDAEKELKTGLPISGRRKGARMIPVAIPPSAWVRNGSETEALARPTLGLPIAALWRPFGWFEFSDQATSSAVATLDLTARCWSGWRAAHGSAAAGTAQR